MDSRRDPEDEAIRDLSKASEDPVNNRVQARHQLKGFLLRHDIRYTGKTSWSIAYFRWLTTLHFDAGAAQTAFTEYWQAVKSADERIERLTKALQASITGWRFEPVVDALQALRGVAAITAIGLVAEIGDPARFAHPRKPMQTQSATDEFFQFAISATRCRCCQKQFRNRCVRAGPLTLKTSSPFLLAEPRCCASVAAVRSPSIEIFAFRQLGSGREDAAFISPRPGRAHS